MPNKKYFTQRISCPLCKSRKNKLIYSKSFQTIKAKEFFKSHLNNNFPLKILNSVNYEIAECQKCKFLFQKNILNYHYNNKYYNDYINQEKAISKNYNTKLNSNIYFNEIQMLNRIFKNKNINILEFGCGLGSWVLSMQKEGYQNIVGIEISKKRRDFLKKKGIKSYEKIEHISKRFDLIYSDQTFEHLVHPGTTIFKIVNLLKENGILIFKIPPGKYFKKKLLKNYYAQKDEAIPLEHINIYTTESIKFLKNKYNFKNVQTSQYSNIISFQYLRSKLGDLYHNFAGKRFIFKKQKNLLKK